MMIEDSPAVPYVLVYLGVSLTRLCESARSKGVFGGAGDCDQILAGGLTDQRKGLCWFEIVFYTFTLYLYLYWLRTLLYFSMISSYGSDGQGTDQCLCASLWCSQLLLLHVGTFFDLEDMDVRHISV